MGEIGKVRRIWEGGLPVKIAVTGATGFLGRHTMPVLERVYGAPNVTPLSSRDYDLMQRHEVESMIDAIKPDVVVHFAGYSGGIGANKAYPADFYYRNTLLTANLFDVAARRGVKKVIYPMGGCSYPAAAVSPISEDQLWKGYPQSESAPYSTAKMMGVVASQSYRTQYGLQSVVIVPGNMYGEFDNFSAQDSHVIAAMIRRYVEAKRSGAEEVKMWGSGAPERDFVYAGDVAALVPYFIDNDDEVGPINLSSGTRTSIRNLAEAIAKSTSYPGQIAWDVSKPDGQMIKIFATEKMQGLGLACPTSLADGLAKTITWFEKNYDSCGDGLRL